MRPKLQCLVRCLELVTNERVPGTPRETRTAIVEALERGPVEAGEFALPGIFDKFHVSLGSARLEPGKVYKIELDPEPVEL